MRLTQRQSGENRTAGTGAVSMAKGVAVVLPLAYTWAARLWNDSLTTSWQYTLWDLEVNHLPRLRLRSLALRLAGLAVEAP